MTPTARAHTKANLNGSDFVGCAGCRTMLVVPKGLLPSIESGWRIRYDGTWYCGACDFKAVDAAIEAGG